MTTYDKIGIVIADIDEYKPFLSAASYLSPKSICLLGKSGHSFTLENGGVSAAVISLNCGIGKVNAAAATAALILSDCGLILNFGLSGGISGVRRGDLVLGTEFFEHDFDLTCLGYAPCEKPGQTYVFPSDKSINGAFQRAVPDLKTGAFATGDRFVSDSGLRNRLRDDFNAVACDMETAAIAGICYENGIPFAALRRISDDAGDDACGDYRNMNTSRDVKMSQAVLDAIGLIIKE